MIKNLFSLFMTLVLLYSCVKTEDPSKKEINKVITFTTTLNKASQTTWEEGDKIGIFMVRESAAGVWETVVDNSFNRCYQTTGNGLFTPATEADGIVSPKDGQTVNFIAYYPYKEELGRTATLYPLDMSDQTDTVKTNFMVSRNLENIEVDGSILTLEFKKPLSKIKINISSEFETSLLKGLTATIHGIQYSKADYSLFDTNNKLSNLKEDTTGTEAIVSANGTLVEITSLAEPNTLAADGYFLFTLKDGRTMKHPLESEVLLEAGKLYSYNIHLEDSGSTEGFFEVLPREIRDVETIGGTEKITLLSKKSWSVKSKPDWVSCFPASGNGSYLPQELAISFKVNNDPIREGEIVFEDKNGTLLRVNLSQKAYNQIGYEAHMRYKEMNEKLPDIVEYPSRNILPTELKWRYYSSNMLNAKLVMEPVSWARFSYESSRLDYLRPGEHATFTIENNNSSEPREVIVKMINYDSVLIRIYKIVQQGTTDYLEVNQSKFNSRGKGDQFDLVVSSRYDWQAEQVPSWITLTRGTTNANKTPISLRCAANQGAQRSATILIKSGNLTQALEVTQNAKKVQNYPYRLPYSIIIHGFGGNDFRFVNGNNGTHNYANTVDIIVIPNDGTTVEREKAYGPYGFVVDPPISKEFKSTEISGGTMVVANYTGNQTVIREIETTIHYNGWAYIYRAELLNFPVPAGLTEEDKLIYTIKMTNIKSSTQFDYSISYEIK